MSFLGRRVARGTVGIAGRHGALQQDAAADVRSAGTVGKNLAVLDTVLDTVLDAGLLLFFFFLLSQLLLLLLLLLKWLRAVRLRRRTATLRLFVREEPVGD